LSDIITFIKTADKLIAKQIMAGKNMIGSKFSILNFSKNSLFIFDSKSNAFSKAMIGDKGIAIQSTHILHISTIVIANSGIAIVIAYNKAKASFNNSVYPLLSDSALVILTSLPICKSDAYNSEKTQAYVESITSFNLFSPSSGIAPFHSLSISSQKCSQDA
jgi:hypothetical protein